MPDTLPLHLDASASPPAAKSTPGVSLSNAVTPLLLPLAYVPQALSISRAHLARLRTAGRFGPAVLRLGRRLLVRRDELSRWVESGMPDARTWAAMRASGRRMRG
jgi:hypothetical protein